MAVHNFRWNGLTAVDAKGRLSVPAAYRQVIEGRGGGREIFVSAHPKLPCVVCYDPGHETKLAERLDEQRLIELQRGEPDRHEERALATFSGADIIGCDPSGRITLHPFLKDAAKITDLALFLGFGEGFQIWDPRTALDHGDERVQRLAAYYLREREADA